MKRKQALVEWNGDILSALALYDAKRQHNMHPVTLLTPIGQPANQMATHGLAAHLIERQAMSMGIPFQAIFHSDGADTSEKLERWKEVINPYRQSVGIEWLVRNGTPGSLMHAQGGLQFLNPLAGLESARLANRALVAGFKALVCTVNASWLDGDLVGLEYNEDFIQMLPQGVDPCGRNGEFYTYVYDGPLFRHPLPVVAGDRFFKRWSFSEKLQAYWYVGLELEQ